MDCVYGTATENTSDAGSNTESFRINKADPVKINAASENGASAVASISLGEAWEINAFYSIGYVNPGNESHKPSRGRIRAPSFFASLGWEIDVFRANARVQNAE